MTAPVASGWSVSLGGAAYFMGFFFFLAGYFTPGAFDRKGGRPFSETVGLGWGLPLLFGWIAIAPLAGWTHVVFGPAALHVDYWTYLTRDFLGFGPKPDDWPTGARWSDNNLGHLWFLEHLLIYSSLYSGLRAARVFSRRMPAIEPPSHGAIAGYALLLGVATFLIRIWYPQDRWIGFLGYIQMEPAHLPQYASLFVIGCWRCRAFGSKPCPHDADWSGSRSAPGSPSPPISWSASASFGASIRKTGGYALGNPFFVPGCVLVPVLCRELRLGGGRMWRALAANVYAVYVFHFPVVLFLQWA